MKERTITSSSEFHEAVRTCWDEYVLFRGEDGEYPLQPKLGRYKAKNWKNFFVKEQYALDEFKRRASPHLDRSPSNDWQWLAVAQHFGLVTRLLDWSENPLVAIHFAAQDPDLNRDRIIYAFRVGDNQFADTTVSPFEIKEVMVYRPEHLATRITSQSGVFTVHPFPERAMESEKLERWRVKQDAVWELLVTARLYGINSASVFPGLDGVASYVNTKYVLGVLYE